MSEPESKVVEEKTITEIFGAQKVKLYKIKHFMFDFGGVMVEKSFAFKNLLDIIKHDLKIKEDFERDPLFRKTRRQLSSGRIDAREFLECVFNDHCIVEQKKSSALPPKKINVDYYLELWFHLYSKFVHLSLEMEKIVTRLHEAGYIVSLISNTFDIHAKSNELKGFYSIFDHVYLSNEIGLIKPDKKKYEYVLDQLGAKPKQCIFVDDKLRNLITAREMGIIVIKFESIDLFMKQLTALGIADIKENLREEIRDKYEIYVSKKKEYKQAKKKYKKAKKKKKKKKKLKHNIDYVVRRGAYKRKKRQYKSEKKKKKSDLVKEFDLT
ncbi:MAG: HAD family phosphatase [Candidatus Lokiarchaeota archaeon]|nr:HAD family phosphatase [Candidatus Lokiarchaeota archaeon]